MAITQVTPDELRDAAREIEKTWSTLSSIQKKLDTDLDPVLRGNAWIGAAKDQFVVSYDGLNKQLTTLLGSLHILGEKVRTGAGTYDEAEHENQQGFNLGDAVGSVFSALGTRLS